MPSRSGLFALTPFSTALSETPAPVNTPAPAPSASPEIRRQLVLGNDPNSVMGIVAQLCDDLLALSVCDTPAAGHVGIALEEALLNAIYHGNLEISSELKENGDEPFHALARERRGLVPYCSRAVRIVSSVTPQGATFVIADEGPGFDVAGLPDPTDPENLLRPSGRGILLMRAFMDDVRYNATGNRVTMVKLGNAERGMRNAE
jgi:anti-sigma regulatory factor (Ser/Thr protein kinase)